MNSIICQSPFGTDQFRTEGFKYGQERGLSSYITREATEQLRTLIYAILHNRTEHCYPLTSLEYDTKAISTDDPIQGNTHRNINKNARGPKKPKSEKSNQKPKSDSVVDQSVKKETLTGATYTKAQDSQNCTPKELDEVTFYYGQHGKSTGVSTERFDKSDYESTRVNKNIRIGQPKSHTKVSTYSELRNEHSFGQVTRFASLISKDRKWDKKTDEEDLEDNQNDTHARKPPVPCEAPIGHTTCNKKLGKNEQISTRPGQADQFNRRQASHGTDNQTNSNNSTEEDKVETNVTGKEEKEDESNKQTIQPPHPRETRVVNVRPTERITDVIYDNPLIR